MEWVRVILLYSILLAVAHNIPSSSPRDSLILKSMDQGRSNQQRTWTEVRRSRRIALTVPVIAYREPKQGLPFDEGTQTLMVNAHGGLMSLATKVLPQQRLMLKNALSGQVQECRVVFIDRKLAGPTDVGFEFLRPAPKFWQIAFPPADWPLA